MWFLKDLVFIIFIMLFRINYELYSQLSLVYKFKKCKTIRTSLDDIPSQGPWDKDFFNPHFNFFTLNCTVRKGKMELNLLPSISSDVLHRLTPIKQGCGSESGQSQPGSAIRLRNFFCGSELMELIQHFIILLPFYPIRTMKNRIHLTYFFLNLDFLNTQKYRHIYIYEKKCISSPKTYV